MKFIITLLLLLVCLHGHAEITPEHHSFDTWLEHMPSKLPYFLKFVRTEGKNSIYQNYNSQWEILNQGWTFPDFFHPGAQGNLTLGENLQFYRSDTAPARPNCTEQKFTYDDFKEIINDKNVSDQMDVLRRIPKDSLQKFTFIYDSHSLQRHGITPMNPRIMRFSTDGKFTLTYSCDPNSPTYNSLEIIYFDDKESKFNFSHTSFAKAGLSGSHHRTSVNHRSCLGCHGGSDPRPNWNEYDVWPGVYGSNDDLMWPLNLERSSEKKVSVPNSEHELLVGTKKEREDYVKFRSLVDDSECLSLLPWPDEKSPGFSHYPYIVENKRMDYNYRPNAHYTIVQSRLNARRVARKIESHQSYERTKYLIASEYLNCSSSRSSTPSMNYSDSDLNFLREIQKTSGIVEEGSKVRPYEEHFIYKLGMLMGLYGSDWDLYFHRGGPTERFRNYSTAQWFRSSFVFSVLFENMSEKDPDLRPFDKGTNRMSRLFGSQFQCVDELADRILLTSQSHGELCGHLAMKHNALSGAYPPISSFPKQERETRASDLNIPRSGLSSKEQGKYIAQKVCGQCHDSDILRFNFKNEKILADQFKLYKEGLVNMVDQKTGTPEKCEMPMSMVGRCLSVTEKKSLLIYLSSFLGKANTAGERPSSPPKVDDLYQ